MGSLEQETKLFALVADYARQIAACDPLADALEPAIVRFRELREAKLSAERRRAAASEHFALVWFLIELWLPALPHPAGLAPDTAFAALLEFYRAHASRSMDEGAESCATLAFMHEQLAHNLAALTADSFVSFPVFFSILRGSARVPLRTQLRTEYVAWLTQQCIDESASSAALVELHCELFSLCDEGDTALGSALEQARAATAPQLKRTTEQEVRRFVDAVKQHHAQLRRDMPLYLSGKRRVELPYRTQFAALHQHLQLCDVKTLAMLRSRFAAQLNSDKLALCVAAKANAAAHGLPDIETWVDALLQEEASLLQSLETAEPTEK